MCRYLRPPFRTARAVFPQAALTGVALLAVVALHARNQLQEVDQAEFPVEPPVWQIVAIRRSASACSGSSRCAARSSG